MKKVIILALALSLVVAGIALATVVSTKHDMGGGISVAGRTISAGGATTTQVCVFCHHPHRGAASATTTLLWNISDASAVYVTYDSPSTNATGSADLVSTDISDAYSLACMGCHDGGGAGSGFFKKTVDGVLGSFPNLGSTTGNLTTTLSDDHPVGFAYPSVTAPGVEDIRLGTAAAVVAGSNVYPLYSGTMQCATCHDVHAGGTPGVQFMRGGTVNIIANSQICVDCHMSK